MTPRLRHMSHEQSLSHLKRRISTQIRGISRAVKVWLKGPYPPQIQVVTPWLPSIQAYPVKWLDRKIPLRQHKLALLLSFCLCWILAFAILVHINTVIGKVEGSGQLIQHLDCVDSFWRRDNACGLDGNECRPFNGSSFAFRCPGNCANVQVLNPYPIGAQDVVYRPLVIGGPIYRDDSFICGSAIYVGLVSDLDGGYGIVSRVGEHNNFPSI
jgi:LCCL domain